MHIRSDTKLCCWASLLDPTEILMEHFSLWWMYRLLTTTQLVLL